MKHLGLTSEKGRFYVDDMLSLVSDKTLQDFRRTDIYSAIMDSDHDAIMDGTCKNEYFNSLLYWACPKIAFLIENGKPWQQKKQEALKGANMGIIYLIKIGEHLYKYGRTKNMRKRILGYPHGSTLLRNDYVQDMYRAEKILLDTVKESDGRLFHGNEYFYLDNDDVAIKCYKKALEKIAKEGL